MTGRVRNIERRVKKHSISNYDHSFNGRTTLADVVNRNLVLSNLKNEGGFISVHLLAGVVIAGLVLAFILISIAMGIQMKASVTYDWFSESMDFAAQAANFDGDISKVTLRQNYAELYFLTTFADITDSTVSGRTLNTDKKYPGPIKLVSFNAVEVGTRTPDGIAKQPGYMATIEVPVFGSHVPVIGPRYIPLTMQYFAVVRSQTI